jgi:hypothetical protein
LHSTTKHVKYGIHTGVVILAIILNKPQQKTGTAVWLDL